MIRFVDWYAAHRQQRRSWRLVIAGDGIDFLRHRLIAVEQASERLDTEAGAVRTLEAIVEDNRAVFAALSRFVAAGHELVLLNGNHDAELHWDLVQARLRELLVAIFVDDHTGTFDAQILRDFASRIAVHRWFHYEPGVLYVEHGNQYDELCAFENVLEPVDEDDRIEAPLSHATMQRFSWLVERLDGHDIDRWSLLDFIRWVAKMDPRAIARSALTYASSPTWLFALGRRRSRACAQSHRRRFDQVLERVGLSEEILLRLDGAKRTLRGGHLVRGLRMLFWDQLALAATCVLSFVAVALLPAPIEVRALTILGSLAVALVVSGRWSRRRDVDPHPKLVEAARSVADVLAVPYVVFGHSHLPDVQTLPSGATYVNTGSWTHDGALGLTYFRLTTHEGELRRWTLPVQEPARFRGPIAPPSVDAGWYLTKPISLASKVTTSCR